MIVLPRLNLIIYLMADRYPGMIPAILSKPTAKLSCDKNMAEASKNLFTIAHSACYFPRYYRLRCMDKI